MIQNTGFYGADKHVSAPLSQQEVPANSGKWKIFPYIDAETGMHPVNHFVISKDAQ
jgi:hypothetical protein